MGRGKNARGDKEFSKLQHALHENKKLKREIARLRNYLDRSYNYEPSEPEETVESKTHSVKAKKDRVCFKCNEGRLVFFEYSHFDGELRYYRKCNCCPYRTKGKKLTPKVERD